MASKVERVENDVHIKAFAEQFHNVLCSKAHIANVSPDKIQGVEIPEGEWGGEGAILLWNYFHDGKACVAKAIESIDRENNKVTFKVTEGDLLQHYKSFKFIIQVSPQQNDSFVHWILEYEKLKDHILDPHTMMELSIEISKDIDAHLIGHK